MSSKQQFNRTKEGCEAFLPLIYTINKIDLLYDSQIPKFSLTYTILEKY
jgi:hypothetical protein